jgi:hypothetical protein
MRQERTIVASLGINPCDLFLGTGDVWCCERTGDFRSEQRLSGLPSQVKAEASEPVAMIRSLEI